MYIFLDPCIEAFLADQEYRLAVIDDVLRLILFEPLVDGNDGYAYFETGKIGNDDLRGVVEKEGDPVPLAEVELQERIGHPVYKTSSSL